jgi:hypothetical protein
LHRRRRPEKTLEPGGKLRPMSTDSIDSGNPPTSEFGGLDVCRDSSARCSTSLFRLLCDVAADAQLLKPKRPDAAENSENETLTLWSNRPGQNATEANALAILSIWLVGGTVVGMTEHFLGPAWWVWLAAIVATPFLTFLVLQIFGILAALCAGGIRKLGIGGERTSERSVNFVSLSGLTVLAILALSWGGPLFLAAAVPWLLWATLNFFATHHL